MGQYFKNKQVDMPVRRAYAVFRNTEIATRQEGSGPPGKILVGSRYLCTRAARQYALLFQFLSETA
jgi:hypothetical protein